MRATRWLLVSALAALAITPFACSDDAGNTNLTDIQCSDGVDNDSDGMTDFPEDLGCNGDDDETEDSGASPACDDGRDNDGDGKTDFPNDPGCFVQQQDSEDDDCPDGPGCPQCANGIDDDGNGTTDFPNDSGCEKAADVEEYTRNPVACGGGVMIQKLKFDGTAEGTLMAGAASNLTSMTCGGSGAEQVYEIRTTSPTVVVATTDLDTTTADTVVYIRGEDCTNASTELACNDNVLTNDKQSTVTHSISTPGTYYVVVDSKDALGGTFALSVKFYVGEGIQCFMPDECGPGLVCRVPKGQTTKVCAKHICEDGLDEDNDGKNDYPDDPGCTSLTDDDESDTCPGVEPTCPECGDGVDNDGDTKIDFGTNGDVTCSAASSASESCISSDGVTTLVAATTMDTTVGATNDVYAGGGVSGCGLATATATAPDKTYRLDLPAMQTLTINNTNSFDASVGFYNSSCTGTPIACDDEPENLTMTNLAAGTYYYMVDGYSTASGAYTIGITGKIANLASCESALAQAGAITCGLGYACQGTVGSRTCQPAVCSDGIDNDSPTDGKIDYPADPGCDSPADTSETNPAQAPVCSNAADDDGDTTIDYPNDFGCAAASGTTEAFCTGEPAADGPAKITAKTTTGVTTGKVNNWTPSCGTSSHTASDVALALNLPVPVTTLVLDTEGSNFDTTVALRTLDCTMELGCDDEGGAIGNTSKLTMTGVAPGGYAVIVDGWSSGNGMFTLNVQGTVAAGTVCNSPLFTGGANAVLVCPTGTTCTGNPTPRCQ